MTASGKEELVVGIGAGICKKSVSVYVCRFHTY
jgi:hypothetical protein